MYPILFSLGPLTIHSYGVFVALGFTTGILVAVKLGKRQGLPAQQVFDMAFIMIVYAIVGSRALYVLINLSYYLKHPLDIMRIWKGGLVFSGGLLAVAPVMAYYLPHHHLSFWKVGDLWAPAIALGQGIGRIGCFMAGCCYGKPTNLPWGVVFNRPDSLAPQGIPLHPTQLYESVSGAFIFLILLIITTKKKFKGQVLVWFLILHSTARLLTERFRGDDRGMIPWTEITTTQLLAVLILLSAVVALFVLKHRYQEKPSAV